MTHIEIPEKKKTWIEIAREYLPECNDDDLNAIIWSYTGFPYFWHIPKDGNTPEECFRKQLQDFKDGKRLGDDDELPSSYESDEE